MGDRVYADLKLAPFVPWLFQSEAGQDFLIELATTVSEASMADIDVLPAAPFFDFTKMPSELNIPYCSFQEYEANYGISSFEALISQATKLGLYCDARDEGSYDWDGQRVISGPHGYQNVFDLSKTLAPVLSYPRFKDLYLNASVPALDYQKLSQDVHTYFKDGNAHLCELIAPLVSTLEPMVVEPHIELDVESPW